MVSTWRFWSAKEINFSRRHPFQLLVLLAIVMYVVIRYSNVVLFWPRWHICSPVSGRGRRIPGRVAGAKGRLDTEATRTVPSRIRSDPIIIFL